jgi:hypothetical protein
VGADHELPIMVGAFACASPARTAWRPARSRRGRGAGWQTARCE